MGTRQGRTRSDRGFLLNHLIHELLPPKSDGMRWSIRAVTGQAAWYDLRVRIERRRRQVSQPEFRRCSSHGGTARRRDAALWAKVDQLTLLPASPPPKSSGWSSTSCLRQLPCLRRQLREWAPATLSDRIPIARCHGNVSQPRPQFQVVPEEGSGQRGGRRGCISQIVPALRRRALRDRLPDRCFHQRTEDGIVLVDESMHRLRPVCVVCPYGAREMDGGGGDEEVHALRRPSTTTPSPGGSRSFLRADVPGQCAPLW